MTEPALTAGQKRQINASIQSYRRRGQQTMRRQTQAKREAILDAALLVFSERGFGETSVTEIAARHGGSKQTLYNYFASKQGLFKALITERASTRFAPILMEFAADPNLSTALRRLASDYLAQITSPDALGIRRLIVAEGHKGELGAIFYQAGPAPFLENLATLLASRMTNGALRLSDPLVAARHLVALIETGPYQWLLGGVMAQIDHKQTDAALDAAVEAFKRAYSPHA